MAHFKKFLWTLAALPLLVGCSDDPKPNSSAVDEFLNGEGDGVYMNVQFRYGSNGSRSYTNDENSSDHDVEVGMNSENKISNILIVLADDKNDYFSHATIEKSLVDLSTDRSSYQAKAKFAKTSIASLYNNAVPDETGNIPVRVFLYCNPNKAIIDYFDALARPNTGEDGESTTDWINQTFNVNTDGSIWTPEHFLMTNVLMANRHFPATIDGWNLYTKESNPFDLSGLNNGGTTNEVDNFTDGGAINVHRMAARFDFADGSQFTAVDKLYPGDTWNGNGIKDEPFTYAVIEKPTAEGVEPIVKAQIVNMSLVNMLNSEYYLGRVSALGRNTGSSLLGAELPWFEAPDGKISKTGNYVVSPFATAKLQNTIKNDPSQYLVYPCFDEKGQPALRGNGWYTTPVTEVTGAKADKNKHPEDATKRYNIWRYVTENTIPAADSDNYGSVQVNSFSTGIVFRAKLLAGVHLTHSDDYWEQQLNNALMEDDSAKPILYLYTGDLYCGWENIQVAAMKAAGWNELNGDDQKLDTTDPLYKIVFGVGGTGTITLTLGNDKKYTYTEHELDENGNPTTTVRPVDQNSLNYLWNEWQASGNTSTLQTNAKWVAFRNAAVAANFTLYEKFGDFNSENKTDDSHFGWGYYCYYYYWNRHNDNYNNGVMGPMEFAVVRNNIYKIAVVRLATLGHPRIPENDPDSPTPDTPDEKGDLYLSVRVEVVPWVVRFNNVEF